jgi:hypothetical protein
MCNTEFPIIQILAGPACHKAAAGAQPLGNSQGLGCLHGLAEKEPNTVCVLMVAAFGETPQCNPSYQLQ